MTDAPRFRRAPEFDCCECGRHIIVCSGLKPEIPLCMTCQFVPGWFENAKVRAFLDPDGLTRPPDLSTAPSWPGEPA